jgi:hypothetical protein
MVESKGRHPERSEAQSRDPVEELAAVLHVWHRDPSTSLRFAQDDW